MALNFEPVPDQPNRINWERLARLFPLGRQYLQNDVIGGAQIENGTVTDVNLTSPNNSVYRSICEHAGGTTTAGAATYFVSGTAVLTASGSNAPGAAQGLIPIRASDFAVNGKTTKLRLAGITFTNGTAPGNTYTHGLYPVTASGGAGTCALTLGTVVTGSTVQVATPAANSEAPFYSSADFDLPADGAYILGVVLSGAGAANSLRMFSCQLQMRHV